MNNWSTDSSISVLQEYCPQSFKSYTMLNPVYAYISNINNLRTHFVENVFKRVRAYVFA